MTPPFAWGPGPAARELCGAEELQNFRAARTRNVPPRHRYGAWTGHSPPSFEILYKPLRTSRICTSPSVNAPQLDRPKSSVGLFDMGPCKFGAVAPWSVCGGSTLPYPLQPSSPLRPAHQRWRYRVPCSVRRSDGGADPGVPEVVPRYRWGYQGRARPS